MSIISVISNVQTSFPVETINQGGVMATLSLIASLSIALLISDSKYWNSWASSTLNTCSIALLITIAVILIVKIILIL